MTQQNIQDMNEASYDFEMLKEADELENEMLEEEMEVEDDNA